MSNPLEDYYAGQAGGDTTGGHSAGLSAMGASSGGISPGMVDVEIGGVTNHGDYSVDQDPMGVNQDPMGAEDMIGANDTPGGHDTPGGGNDDDNMDVDYSPKGRAGSGARQVRSGSRPGGAGIDEDDFDFSDIGSYAGSDVGSDGGDIDDDGAAAPRRVDPVEAAAAKAVEEGMRVGMEKGVGAQLPSGGVDAIAYVDPAEARERRRQAKEVEFLEERDAFYAEELARQETQTTAEFDLANHYMEEPRIAHVPLASATVTRDSLNRFSKLPRSRRDFYIGVSVSGCSTLGQLPEQRDYEGHKEAFLDLCAEALRTNSFHRDEKARIVSEIAKVNNATSEQLVDIMDAEGEIESSAEDSGDGDGDVEPESKTEKFRKRKVEDLEAEAAQLRESVQGGGGAGMKALCGSTLDLICLELGYSGFPWHTEDPGQDGVYDGLTPDMEARLEAFFAAPAGVSKQKKQIMRELDDDVNGFLEYITERKLEAYPNAGVFARVAANGQYHYVRVLGFSKMKTKDFRTGQETWDRSYPVAWRSVTSAEGVRQSTEWAVKVLKGAYQTEFPLASFSNCKDPTIKVLKMKETAVAAHKNPLAVHAEDEKHASDRILQDHKESWWAYCRGVNRSKDEERFINGVPRSFEPDGPPKDNFESGNFLGELRGLQQCIEMGEAFYWTDEVIDEGLGGRAPPKAALARAEEEEVQKALAEQLRVLEEEREDMRPKVGSQRERDAWIFPKQPEVDNILRMKEASQQTLDGLAAAVARNKKHFEARKEVGKVVNLNKRNLKLQDELDHKLAELEGEQNVKDQVVKRKELMGIKTGGGDEVEGELNPFKTKECAPRNMWDMVVKNPENIGDLKKQGKDYLGIEGYEKRAAAGGAGSAADDAAKKREAEIDDEVDDLFGDEPKSSTPTPQTSVATPSMPPGLARNGGAGAQRAYTGQNGEFLRQHLDLDRVDALARERDANRKGRGLNRSRSRSPRRNSDAANMQLALAVPGGGRANANRLTDDILIDRLEAKRQGSRATQRTGYFEKLEKQGRVDKAFDLDAWRAKRRARQAGTEAGNGRLLALRM